MRHTTKKTKKELVDLINTLEAACEGWLAERALLESRVVSLEQEQKEHDANLTKVEEDCGYAAGFVDNVVTRLVTVVGEGLMPIHVFEEAAMKLVTAYSLLHRETTAKCTRRLMDHMQEAKDMYVKNRPKVNIE